MTQTIRSRDDLLRSEARGGGFGQLSADAVASNFGKVRAGSAPARADVAAGLITMIAQTIALIAINAARAESLRDVVLVGRLASLPSIAAVLLQTSGLFNLMFQVPAHGGYANHDPLRPRKLLLHRQEILKLAQKTRAGGHTLVPLRLYLSKGRVKVEIALAKGKNLWDKREAIKERDQEKEARAAIRERRRS